MPYTEKMYWETCSGIHGFVKEINTFVNGLISKNMTITTLMFHGYSKVFTDTVHHLNHKVIILSIFIYNYVPPHVTFSQELL